MVSMPRATMGQGYGTVLSFPEADDRAPRPAPSNRKTTTEAPRSEKPVSTAQQTSARRAQHLPPPRQIDWQMKPLESAKVSEKKVDGELECRIQHDVLKGVTPDMLVWWFENLHGDMQWKGKTIPMYHLWHPIDHIKVEVLKPAPTKNGMGAGATIRINEMFGDQLVHHVAEVVKLDKDGIELKFKLGPFTAGHLTHTFKAVPGGTQYNSCLRVGFEIPGLRSILNPIATRMAFPDESGLAWLKHNVEEVGNLQFFLPKLYKQRTAIEGSAAAAAQPSKKAA
jgi:hypothetical protein